MAISEKESNNAEKEVQQCWNFRNGSVGFSCAASKWPQTHSNSPNGTNQDWADLYHQFPK